MLQSFKNRIQDPRRKHAIQIRNQVEQLTREFFARRNYLETRTPLLVQSPGMEPHIRPFITTQGATLPTSPEFAMKKLLAGGLEKIFQICPAFRDEPSSPHHSPEFTMLEWYQVHHSLEGLMKETEEWVEFLAQKITGGTVLPWGEHSIEVQTPWPRFTVRELFQKYADIDLCQTTSVESMREECERLNLNPGERARKTWDDYAFLIWLNAVEPCLPCDRTFFVTHYPPSQAALAKIVHDSEGNSWASRFEFYAGGLELGNAFEELTDPKEQRERFEKDMNLRESTYGGDFPKSEIDEDFIRALVEGIPPTSGIAVGLDRVVMLLAHEKDIDFTFWLPAYRKS